MPNWLILVVILTACVFPALIVRGKARDWRDLRELGNRRLIRSSYLWLVIVPVVAKALAPVAGEHELTIWGADFRIHLTLPFSWVIFYFMAIAFAAAELVYALWCPIMVKQYASFAEYRRDDPGIGPLVLWADVAFRKIAKEPFARMLTQLCGIANGLRGHCDNPNNTMGLDALKKDVSKEPNFEEDVYVELAAALRIDLDLGDEAMRSEVWNIIHYYIRSVEPKARLRASWLFGVGLCLFVIVLIQSFIAVIRVVLAS